MRPPAMVEHMKAQKYLYSLVVVTMVYFTVAMLLSPAAHSLTA